MYKAKHMKYTRRRVTLPMLVLIAALCVAILVFPTSANDASASPDAVSGARSPMSPGTSGTYSVVPSAQHGGSVVPGATDAAAGKLVTFSVKPDDGFETASVAVISASGSCLEVVRVKGEDYKFVMPSEGVTIDVSFQYLRSA
ncbi:MAG TPA: hypothetical protein IAC26_05805 [Candidatus Scatomorpha stercoravium]|nr:hypothetical protein [Candidatus Scatomorpha stercoravium]